jgi:predicted Zn-dependent protease
MKTIKKLSFLLFVCILSIMFFSCTSVSQIVSASAQIAGLTGVIDENVADGITTMSDAIGKAAEEITPSQEYYIGRAVAANILGKYELYFNPTVESYLNSICQAIVINSDKPELYKGYYVAILDSEEINAFATSGGHILITRGLLQCTASEDALAAVIAHEVAHIQLQHNIKAIKSSRATNAILATASSAIKISGKEELIELTDAFGESVNEVVNSLVNSGYSQEQEFQADKTALNLMLNAGYNPVAMTEMLNLLKTRLGSDNTGFGKTHPSAQARLLKVNIELKAISAKDSSASRLQRFNLNMNQI